MELEDLSVSPQTHNFERSRCGGNVIIIPVLEKLGQVDPWCSMDMWPNLIIKLQASKRPCLKQKGDGFM